MGCFSYRQCDRGISVADTRGSDLMGLILFPDLRLAPVAPAPGSYVALRNAVLPIHLDVRLVHYRGPPRCRDWWYHRDVVVHHGNDLQRCDAATERPPRLLDLHVPGIPTDIPDRGLNSDGAPRPTHHLLPRGVERLQPAVRNDMR